MAKRVAVNCLVFAMFSAVGVGPLLYLSFCDVFGFRRETSIEGAFVAMALVSLCVGPLALVVWVGREWRDKPQFCRFDRLLLLLAANWISFWYLASWYLRK